MPVSPLLRGAVLGLAVAALLVPTAAHAGKSVHRDAVGDVVSLTLESEPDPGNEEFVAVPDQKRGDITRTVARHGAKRVTFTMKMRALHRKAESGVFARVVTNKRNYSVDVFHAPGFGKAATLATRRGDVIECDGLAYERRKKQRSVVVSVPRKCLGNPRWVRLGAGVFHVRNGTKAFLDESHRDGMNNLNNVAVGPKVRR